VLQRDAIIECRQRHCSLRGLDVRRTDARSCRCPRC
jgi:hypothetical protein